MKRILVLLVLMATLSYLIYKTREPNNHEESVHYHAGFIVYKDGVKQDFSDFKYMNFTPCSEHDAKKSKEEEQIEKAHLHDGIGDVVHVHRHGGTWGDLFNNIAFNLPTDTTISAYKDGKPIENILSHPITPDESIVIVVGNTGQVDTQSYVSLEHIKEVEKKSELCGS